MLSFRLDDDFVEDYAQREVPWGFECGGGNSVGELTYLRTYSRIKEDGVKEQWHETVRRVVEGTYSIQRDHAVGHRLPWSDEKAQKSAQEMYDRIFNFKFLPPGRGLWMMGSDFVHGRSDGGALNNCGYTSTQDLAGDAAWLMEASMLGVGVGFDTSGAGLLLYEPETPPEGSENVFTVPDSRQGWVESVERLLKTYLEPGHTRIDFDYSRVRPAGEPIRGFGGVASGPGPLRDLHENLRHIFDGRAGEKTTTKDVVDVMNLIGRCVVAGNVRRTAEIALGSGDDQEFLDLKNYEVFPERNDFQTGWGWASNNSVVITDDTSEEVLNDVTKRAAVNGEPGVFWLDKARKYGRMSDPPNNRDWRVAGTNPCSFAGETIVMTTDGPRRIDELEGQPFWALVDGRSYLSPGGSWVTGRDDIYRLTTKSGYEVNLTSNHEVKTASGEWVEAGDLEPGDEIVIHNHRRVPSWGGRGLAEEGYLLGALVGDGYIGGNGSPTVQVWQSDDGYEGIYNEMERCAANLEKRSDWQGWRDHGRGYYAMSIPKWLLDAFGIDRDNKTVTSEIERASADFQAAFLRALFDADGHIEGWQEDNDYKGASIRLAQSDYEALVAVQRMLLRFGVKSRIYQAKDAHMKDMPDGKGGTKSYHCKASWRLVVSSDDVPVYAERIGFSHDTKAEKLDKVLATRTFHSKPFVATVDNFEYVRTDEVWDLTVSDMHAFDANGLYVSNSEQSLESRELCCLVETFPTNHDDLEDFKRTLKFAYLYAKTVTLMPTSWPETNAIMLRNRRIGCSVSGVAQFLEHKGVDELKHWLEEGYAEVQRRDLQYSEWLCIRESIKTTSVKPSGSVSLLAGVTPGVHFPPTDSYIRRVRLAITDPLVEALKSAGYKVEPAVNDPDNTVVVELPVSGLGVRSENDVDLQTKADIAALLQYYWADNQVSVTLTFDPNTEGETAIADVLKNQGHALKSASFLPTADLEHLKGQFPQLPYEPAEPEDIERMKAGVTRMDLTPVFTANAAEDAAGDNYCSTDKCEIEIGE